MLNNAEAARIEAERKAAEQAAKNEAERQEAARKAEAARQEAARQAEENARLQKPKQRLIELQPKQNALKRLEKPKKLVRKHCARPK